MIGALDIELAAGDASPVWRIAATGGMTRAGWVVGRTPEEAARLVPRVFNLCAGAHAEAAHAALGLPAPAGAHATLARRERLREHAVAILNDWPLLLGRQPDRAALRGLAQLQDDAQENALALRRHLVGADIDLADATPGEIERWLDAAATPTAGLLAHIHAHLDPAWGRAELAVPRADEIAAALEAGTPAPRETTAADRWRDAPSLRALHAREGASLFLRMFARLLDLLGGLDARRDQTPELALPGTGIGLARAARGILAHRARVVDGRVADYRVLSPSAWNLASGGLLARMLAALPMGAQTPMLARLVVSCVNPCVPVALRLGAREETAHA